MGRSSTQNPPFIPIYFFTRPINHTTIATTTATSAVFLARSEAHFHTLLVADYAPSPHSILHLLPRRCPRPSLCFLSFLFLWRLGNPIKSRHEFAYCLRLSNFVWGGWGIAHSKGQVGWSVCQSYNAGRILIVWFKSLDALVHSLCRSIHLYFKTGGILLNLSYPLVKS